MAAVELFYYNDIDVLVWPAIGMRFKAVSGTSKGQHAPLPPGKYTVLRREIVDTNDPPFVDKITKKGFFVPVVPLFSTTRGQNGRLGIHPDGRYPGTEGCIGIAAGESHHFYDAFKQLAANAVVTLEVY